MELLSPGPIENDIKLLEAIAAIQKASFAGLSGRQSSQNAYSAVAPYPPILGNVLDTPLDAKAR